MLPMPIVAPISAVQNIIFADGCSMPTMMPPMLSVSICIDLIDL